MGEKRRGLGDNRQKVREPLIRCFCPSWGVFQRPLTPILLQKYRDTNGSRTVIQIGGVYTHFCTEEGIL